MTALLLAFVLSAPAAAKPPQAVTFKTKDGWTIAADYRAPKKGGVAVILVHGVASSKGEWIPLAQRLEAAGVGSLSIDLRGHSGSTHAPSGTRTYRDLDVTGEWPRAVEDILAARRWLSRRVSSGRIAYAGASIGANLASQAAAQDPAPLFLVLLSPGADYRGVALATRPGLKTFAAASRGDGYAFSTLDPLSHVPGAEIAEAPAGHGAQMFDDADFMSRLVAWISAASR
jgi:alpha-beta hydrolase superfamily lysophospholipase